MSKTGKGIRGIPLQALLCAIAAVCAVALIVPLVLSYSGSVRELDDVRRQVAETQAVASQLNDVKTEVKTARTHLNKNGKKGVEADIKSNNNQLSRSPQRIEDLKEEIRTLQEAIAKLQ